MHDFNHKRILITGGSAGIGLAIAEAFAREGACLALLARGEEGLATAASSLSSNGTEVSVHTCDVGDPVATADAVVKATQALGGLDGVVANSGFCRPGRFHEIPIEALDGMVNTNLAGVIHTLHPAIPHLLANPESFAVITSSPAGNASIYGFNVYGATKAALNHLARGLRSEYQDRGLHVMTLLPPDTDTPGYEEEVEFYPAETRAILAGGRLHPAESVATACLDSLRRKRPGVTIGKETKLLLPLVRHMPWLWEWYSRGIIRKTRKKGNP